MAARHYPLHFLIDTDGTPLTGGTVSCFEAGTTTPAKIYPTRDDATNDTNGSVSVTLSSDGGLIIWIDDITRKKLVIRDADGAIIPNGTIDEISGEFDLSTSGLTLGGVLNTIQGTNIASATTTDIATADGNYIVVTGTTTITGFGTVQAGAERLVKFSSSLTLTHNATSLILPTGANIYTRVGDILRAVSLGSGNWEVLWYKRKVLLGEDIASATTTDLSLATGDYLTITGTTTITGLGSCPIGTSRKVTFSGILTLTHGANLLLPSAANITTAVNDTAEFISFAVGQWFCIRYTRYDGTPITPSKFFGGAGTTIASASTTNLATATGSVMNISGTTTITSFGTVAAGQMVVLYFEGILTITHHATSLRCIGAQNIKTAAGDIAVLTSLGSGNWAMVSYARSTPRAPDVASATTTDISVIAGDVVDITGTTTITGLGTAVTGVVKNVRFTGALLLTHNATSLILPTAANITTAAGDTATFVSLGSGNWLCAQYQKISGKSLLPAGRGLFVAKDVASLTSAANLTWTKVSAESEVIDVEGWYDNATNFRYTPLVAGHYFFYCMIAYNTTNAAAEAYCAIYKNGAHSGIECATTCRAANLYLAPAACGSLDMNGTTDYVEFYTYQNGGGTESPATGGSNFNGFGGYLLRSA